MERNRRILIVDDQQDLREQLAKLLARSGKRNDTQSLVQQMRSRLLGGATEGDGGSTDVDDEPAYFVDTVGQGQDALERVREANAQGHPYAVMFLDMRMPPGWDGMETARRIREVDRFLEIVIMTAYADHDQQEIADTVGVPEKMLYIKKPFQAEEIHQLALSLTSKWTLEQAELARRHSLEVLLRGMSRIKSAGIVGAEDCHQSTLKAILDFTHGKRGFLAIWNDSTKAWAAVVRQGLEEAMALDFLRQHDRALTESRTTQHLEGKYLLPLKRDKFSGVAVVYDVVTRSDPEWYKFLSLLTMTATEALSNAASVRKSIEQDRFAAIGIAMSKLSHEAKNMLNQMLGFAGQLHSHVAQDPAALGLVDAMMLAGEQMLRQFQNVLIYSKDEPATRSDVDLVAHVREAVSAAIATAGGNRARTEFTGAAALTLPVDADLLHRAMYNLAVNSLAAKPEGPLTIRVDLREEPRKVILAYSDDGPGVPPAIRATLFDPFVSQSSSGIGLGMAIVRQVVEKHGGEIAYEEAPGGGAKFVITLPKPQA
jgi:signal transduction histidine kinase